MTQDEKKAIAEALATKFSHAERRTLLNEMGASSEDVTLRPTNARDEAWEIVGWFERRGNFAELRTKVERKRPPASSHTAAHATAATPASSIHIGSTATGNVLVQETNQTATIRDDSAPGDSPPAQPIKILFLGASPSAANRRALSTEVREIERNLRESDIGCKIEVKQEWAVRTTDLSRILLQHRPHIVHFSGLGTRTRALVFKDDLGKAVVAPAAVVTRLFSIVDKNVRCVVLNACWSRDQADAIRQHVDCVVGMKGALKDKAAITFASLFYVGIGRGDSVKKAFDSGCKQINFADDERADVPALLCKNGVDPATVLVHDTEDAFQNTITESELVQCILSGDKRRTEQFIHEYRPNLLAAIKRILRRRERSDDADDVVQEILTEILQRPARILGTWSPSRGRSLINYLRVFAAYRTIDYLRRHPNTEFSYEERLGFVEQEQIPRIQADISERMDRVFQLYRKRYPDDWHFVVRSFIDEAPAQVIAEEFGTTKTVIHARRSRTRKRFLTLIRSLETQRRRAPRGIPK